MGNKGYLERFVMQTQVVSGDKNHSPLPGMGKGRTFTNGNLSPSQWEIYGLLICVYLKMINMPK